MRTVLLILALAGLASAAAAQDTIVALPLLEGDYDAGDVLPNDQPSRRSCTFEIPPQVENIAMMRMVMSGSATEGAYITERDVGGIVVRDTIYYPGYMYLSLSAPPLGEATLYSVQSLPETGATNAEAHFLHSEDPGPPDFNLLLGATIEAELILRSGLATGHWIDPLASVTDLHLRIEGQIVPAAARSWGEIKTLFR